MGVGGGRNRKCKEDDERSRETRVGRRLPREGRGRDASSGIQGEVLRDCSESPEPCCRALRQKYTDAGKGSPRDLTFLAYGVEFPSDTDRHPDSPEPPEFILDSEVISWIEEMGIQVAGNKVVSGDSDTNTTESILSVTRDWIESRESAEWEIDGVVIKLRPTGQERPLG